MQWLQTVKGLRSEEVESNFNHVRRNPPTRPGSKRSGQALANRRALRMHILAFSSPQFRWDVVHAHTRSAATCPVLTQRFLVNYPLPLCLPLILLQFKGRCLSIPLNYQLPKAGTSVGRITSNFKEKTGGRGLGGVSGCRERGRGKQRWVWTEGQEEIPVLSRAGD